MRNFIILFIASIMLVVGCKQATDQHTIDKFYRTQLPEYNRRLTQVIIGDVFTPPVCSRIYAYTNIAAYEATRQGYRQYPSYAYQLHDLKKIPEPAANEILNYPVSGMIAFFTVAQKLVFNNAAVIRLENDYLTKLDEINIDKELLERSVNYGRKVGEHVLDWASKDGYLQRTSLPGYMVNKKPERWQPTPPDYMDAIEPNWKTLRPFVLDSASQFRPSPPSKFDTTAQSAFFMEAMEVYKATTNAKSEQIAMAKFWDCNPNISVTQGHVTYFQQKISPGGHWIHIASSIVEKEQYDPMKAAEIISKTAITLADAFISCWESKYQYNLVRPETYINKYIDKNWKPLLQTPAFPEYTSGHSVASSSAAVMLSKLIGEHYHYKDSTEAPFGLPIREYNSFLEASEEASMSRLYGGIHYLPAIKNGIKEGTQVGNFIFTKLNSSK